MSTDPYTGRNPSYCFVELPSKSQAEVAMKELSGQLLLGRPVKIGPGLASSKKPSFDYVKATVFKRWTQTDASNHFEGYTYQGRRVWVGGLPEMGHHSAVNAGVRELFAGCEILLSLAPETRYQIWEELFSSGEDIVLYQSIGVRQRIKARAEKKAARAAHGDEDSFSDEDEDRETRVGKVRARVPLPVGCLRVNHQLFEECTIAMFRDKSIRFDTDPEAADWFLKHVPSYQCRLIRHLVFGMISTGFDPRISIKLDSNNRDRSDRSWETIRHSIARLRVQTVTLWVPSDKHDRLCHLYHWPPLKGVIKVLLSGGIGALRVYFSNESNLMNDHYEDITRRYRESGPVFGKGHKLATDRVPVEMDQILEMCNPRMKEALDEFTRDHAQLKETDPYKFWDRWEVFWPVWERQKQVKVDLRREESTRGGEGTVIVITRPSDSAPRRVASPRPSPLNQPLLPALTPSSSALSSNPTVRTNCFLVRMTKRAMLEDSPPPPRPKARKRGREHVAFSAPKASAKAMQRSPWRHIVCEDDGPENRGKQKSVPNPRYYYAVPGAKQLPTYPHHDCHLDYEDPGSSRPIEYHEHKGMRLTVMRVSRQLYAEANYILWTTNTFSCADGLTFQRFMMTRTLSQKRLVRNLRFDMEWDYGVIREWNRALNMVMVKSLIGLQTLRLNILYDLERWLWLSGKDHLLRRTSSDGLRRLSTLPLRRAEVAFRIHEWRSADDDLWQKADRDECAEKLREILVNPQGAEVYAVQQCQLKFTSAKNKEMEEACAAKRRPFPSWE
ncbi:MAG: hypothetical protein Q9169_007469 [Polycauliona sp. 2 TL-2023]